MEGDLAVLPEICALAEKYGAEVMVDDAHGLGVFGKNGRGTCDHFGLSDKVSLIMGTFSKSFASLGGFIASDTDVIDFLRHFSRALMFSASMPPANVAAVKASLEIMQSEPERIEKLWHNTNLMAAGLKRAGFNLNRSQSPIIPIMVGEDLTVFKMCRQLLEEGVFVNPVVSPAVEPGKAIIRVSLMATHSDEEINYSLEKLTAVGKKMGVIN
jgi:7-keto-8-aminopelargonate synthetase-like enzyme